MDIILISKEIGKSKYSYLAQSFVVSVAFIMLLTLASASYSAYRGELAHKRMTTSTSVANHTKLSSQIKTLQTRAKRLKKAGKKLVKRKRVRKSGTASRIKSRTRAKHKNRFSVTWDNVISGQPTNPVAIAGRGLKSRFGRHDDTAKMKRSIQIVSKNLLRQYRYHSTSLPDGWPLPRGRVSSKYGKRGRRMHKGLDIAAKTGTPVFAIEAGIIVRAKHVRGYGRLIEIKHGDMYSTRYGHNSKLLVKSGDRVYKGQAVALVGSTGRSSGPHVHFEIRQSGIAINPLKYLGAMAYFSLAENVKLSQYVKLSKK